MNEWIDNNECLVHESSPQHAFEPQVKSKLHYCLFLRGLLVVYGNSINTNQWNVLKITEKRKKIFLKKFTVGL